ncbi:MAG: YlbL family protein, partial [Sciscionella sp.]
MTPDSDASTGGSSSDGTAAAVNTTASAEASTRSPARQASGRANSAGPASRRWTRRTWTLVISVLMVAAFGLLGALVPIPYVAIGPGPTFNTLGAVDGKQVVTVHGTKTYPTRGQFRMVTVSETTQIHLFSGLGLWLSGREALAPRDEYFPPGQSQRQVDRQNVQMFKNSQTDAEVAALRYLHYPLKVVANRIVSGGPSDHKIAAGDQLLRVNGTRVGDAAGVVKVMSSTKPGQRIPVVLKSTTGAAHTVHITLGSSKDRSFGFLGIVPIDRSDVPFDIKISLQGIGGPSAGLIFALSVVDK